MGNLYNGILDLDRNPSYIEKITANEKEYLIKQGDILITLTGTQNKQDYGYTVYINEDMNSLLNQRCAFIKSHNVNAKYLYYLMNTNRFKIQFFSSATGGTGNQTNVSTKDIESFSMYVPSRSEQNVISNFLTKIDERITAQSKIINKLESLICSLRSDIFSKYDWEWKRLDSFISNGIITLKRGNVIQKHEKNEEFKFPVYSSSIHNNGLMGFNNSYMFDKELITWSVDGGGNFFYRSKHKFNVTNVCGIMEVKDNIFNYRFLSEILSAQHSKMIFDYQTKAHPSVIEKLYKLPIVDVKTQEKIALIFELYYQKLEKEKDILSLYKKQKAYLLQNMFI